MGVTEAVRDNLSRKLALALLRERPSLLLRYGSSYINRKQTIANLTGASLAQVQACFHHVLANHRLKAHLQRESISGSFYGQSLFKAYDLYVICRLLRPKIVVETGVAAGYSSAFLLQALADMKIGALYSIDLGVKEFEDIKLAENKEIGWFVPDWLRPRWNLRIGSSLDVLEPLLHELKEVNLFFHDSDHTYGTMMFEFEAAWSHLSTPGIIVSDDIDFNTSFFDFCRQHMLKPRRILFQLGGSSRLK